MPKNKEIKKGRTGNFLSKIYLNNFKSFFSDKNIEIKFAPRITLLFGRNSSGKSSILQAIKLMEQSFQKDMDIYLNPPDNDPGGLKFVDYKTIAANGDLSKPITLGLQVNDPYIGIKDDYKDDKKTIIKNLFFKNKKLHYCNVDFHSSSEDFNEEERKNDKFLCLENEIFDFKGLDNFFKSKITYIENKYAWKELFEYTFIHKDKVLDRLEESEVFYNKFEKILELKDRKEQKELMRKLFKGSGRGYGKFDPADFKFYSLETINNYQQFIKNMKKYSEKDYENFIKYISNDIKKVTKFLFKNNRTFNISEITRIIGSKISEKEDLILWKAAASNATLAQFLCFVVSEICGAKRPTHYEFDPNVEGKMKKVLEPDDMINICRDRINKVLSKTLIFHGQRPLPQKFEPYTGPSDFVGYDFAGLPTVINANQQECDKWLKKFGYDFRVKPETGGPLHDTIIVHKKDNLKINYKFGGLGAENILPVIAQSVAADGKIIIFEEPERRAHPRLQIKMADLFVKCSEKNQFIVETHSENLLLGILKNVKDGEIKPEDIQISYVYIDKGQSKIDHLTVNDNGKFSSNWRDGFFTERLDLL